MNFDEAIAKAVRRRGRGYVYKRPDTSGICLYVHTTGWLFKHRSGGCLLGTALGIMGVPWARIEDFEGIPCQRVMSSLRRDGLIEVTEAQITAAGFAQNIQDQGGPWGQAHEAYLDAIAQFALWLAEVEEVDLVSCSHQ